PSFGGMKIVPLTLVVFALLAGCGRQPEVAVSVGTGAEAPPPRPSRGAALGSGASAEAFVTTTPAERAAALAGPAPGAEARLGTTIASLGNPAEPGLWLQTPLVSSTRPGRIRLKG